MPDPTPLPAGFPELRPAPPWVTEEMIAEQPAVARALLAEAGDAAAGAGALADAVLGALANAVLGALGRGEPVVVTGCGTSGHAAQGVAALLSDALGEDGRGVRAVQALEAALDPQRGGLCVAVSHDGGTRATILALEAARDRGAATALVTARPDGPAVSAAGTTLLTPVVDRSWCHTVGYTSPLLAGAAVARRLGLRGVDGDAAARVLGAGAALAPAAAEVAGRLADRRFLLTAGAGVDAIGARELALKIAEGAQLPSLALTLEEVLHGHLAGHDATTGLVLVHTLQGARVDRRAAMIAQAAQAIGIPVAAVLTTATTARLPDELTPAGRLVVAAADDLAPTLAGLLQGAAALQALTVALAGERRTNPDLIRREQAPYRRAGEAGEGGGDW